MPGGLPAHVHLPGVLYLLAQATLFSGPLLLRRIVEAIECNEAGGEDCASTMDMYVFALIMTLAGVVQNFCQAQRTTTCSAWACACATA